MQTDYDDEISALDQRVKKLDKQTGHLFILVMCLVVGVAIALAR